MDLSVAAVLVLGGLVALRWGVVLVLALLVLRPARRCPACFASTVRIRRRLVTLLLPVTEWRWCPRCRWQGLGLKRESPWTA